MSHWCDDFLFWSGWREQENAIRYSARTITEPLNKVLSVILITIQNSSFR